MSDEIEFESDANTSIWAAFGDLMSVLLGAFVLILVGVIGVQLQLSSKLDEAVKHIAHHGLPIPRLWSVSADLTSPEANS